ncbi:hypothetical protein JRQ81_006740 [Phrynocephalus forsythii]|uniref:WD repeat-containing protein 76 n=1 Tax=Phrynocephalus forsythii TaxID=171643 RepID=A0A9Q0XDR7_9SAUR|nr:hypothetical protein JRQ81_006740 [Phrynocephalus forsythii]
MEAEAAGRAEEALALSRPRTEEKPPKENPNACQARVLLIPLSFSKSEYTRNVLPQKRLLEEISSSEESPSRDHKIKKVCNRPSSSVVTSEVSPSPAAAVANKDSGVSDVPASVVPASSRDSESDGDLESDTKDEDEAAELSAYERKRLKNIAENANFFASLKLFESAARLREMTVKGKSHGIKSYKTRVREMALKEDCVAKVVTSRIYSVAIHPSESRTLVAAGDKWGQIGLWNLDSRLEEGVYSFVIHSGPVSCIHFSSFNPAHLFSLSHDGTLRCGDVTRAVFDEVYRNEDSGFSSFDFLAADASTLIVGMWDGGVAIVDKRTPENSAEISADLNSMIRTVHVHPVSRHYFMTAGARNVNIYDVRHLKESGNKPVVSLAGHTKSVASAYFSPVTGNRAVTTCADDKLRIFGTKCLATLAPVLTTIKHNNNTGRWLTRFRAVWDPKRDDCFVVGSMLRPRQINAFHATGELVHSFFNENHLGSVCSINVWHPTRYILVGGNSSGRLHVFR